MASLSELIPIMPNTIEVSIVITESNIEQKASALLAKRSGLSQAKIKDAMTKGAVWIIRGKNKKRLRRASQRLKVTDQLQLFYNEDILNQTVLSPQLIADEGDYSLWFKPFGLACQGSRFGDFSSIQRWLETYIWRTGITQRPAFLVHRLDKATSGVLLIAHSKKAAKLFSQKFEEHEMDKRYQALVKGYDSRLEQWFSIETDIDEKPSRTDARCLHSSSGFSVLELRLHTGRKHQIRQHLASIGLPIVGDRLYGQGLEDAMDLQLQAKSLIFYCPYQHKTKVFFIPAAMELASFNFPADTTSS